MKISHLRNLSWSISIFSVTGAILLCQNLIEHVQETKVSEIELWQTPEFDPSIFESTRKKLSDRQILSNTRFITKRKPVFIPTPPIDDDEKNKKINQAIPQVVHFPNNIKLKLIAYDDSVNKRHAAFILSRRYAHPYFEGEEIEATQGTVIHKINRSHVILRNPQGKLKKLIMEPTYHNAIFSGRVPIVTTGGPNVSKPEPVRKVSRRTPYKVNTNKTRSVPKWRKAEYDQRYGFNVITYEPYPDGSQRYAISPKGLKTLRDSYSKLITDATLSVATDKSGKEYGAKIQFNHDQAILAKYGIKDGDIVTHINDTKVNSVTDGMNLYENMSENTRRVKVTIERNNRLMSIYLEMDDYPNTPEVNR